MAATQTTVPDGSIREVLDLGEVLRSIGTDEINELHVEAGAAVNGALISAGLVDEIVAFVAPAFMGEGMPAARLPVFTSMDEVSRWRFESVERMGEDLELVLRPWTQK